MSKFTFLNAEQIWGKRALPMITEIGREAKITDLSLLLCGKTATNGNFTWWTSSPIDIPKYLLREEAFCKTPIEVRCVDCVGSEKLETPDRRDVAARPSYTFSRNKKLSDVKMGKEYEKYFEYYAGEYPQTAVREDLAEKLNNMMLSGLLKQTGKTYTFDSLKKSKNASDFTPRVCHEYGYNGEKYICLDNINDNVDCCLGNCEKVECGKKYWIKVEPIKWLVDKKTGVAITEKLLFAGIQFNNSMDYKGSFSKTNIARYLENYFSKEIIPKNIKQKEDREF